MGRHKKERGRQRRGETSTSTSSTSSHHRLPRRYDRGTGIQTAHVAGGADEDGGRVGDHMYSFNPAAAADQAAQHGAEP